MSKFFVKYELPYTHIVVVGIEAEDAEAARTLATKAFADGTLWDNKDIKLLHDSYEEDGESSVLEFLTHPCGGDDFPEPMGPLMVPEYRGEEGVPFDSGDWK